METIFKHNCTGSHRHGHAWARCAFPGVRVTGSGPFAVIDRNPVSGEVRGVSLWQSAGLAAECSGEMRRIRFSCPHERMGDVYRGIRVTERRCWDCDRYFNVEEK